MRDFFSKALRWGGLLLIQGALCAGDVNLVQNGSFESDGNGDGWPDGWSRDDQRLHFEKDGQRKWIVEEKGNPEDGGVVTNSSPIPVKPDWEAVVLKCEMRVTDVVKGAENWHDARVMITFKGPDGKRVGDWPPVFNMSGTSGWQKFSKTYPIPSGTASIQISCGLFGTGKAEFSNIELIPKAKETKTAFEMDKGTGGKLPPSYNLLQNGSLNVDEFPGAKPEGWNVGDSRWKVGKGGGNAWLIVERDSGGGAGAGQSVRLDPLWRTLELQAMMRATDVKAGEESWQDARVTIAFFDADGKQAGGWPPSLSLTGTSDWKEFKQIYKIPEGAVEARVGFGLWGTGKAEFDELTLKVADLKGPPKNAKLPEGVKAEWDIAKAFREKTPTRERICLNGLWRWTPATARSPLPEAGWGYFKVPGPWPMTNFWSSKESQRCFPSPSWEGMNLHTVSAAWYQREFSVPADWAGRRIALRLECLNSYAEAYVDGLRAGEIYFPGGEIDLASQCHPGSKHTLTLFVAAIPMNEDIVSFGTSYDGVKSKAEVVRRGLCGDLWLKSFPAEARIQDVKISTFVRSKSLEIDAALDLKPGSGYMLSARVVDAGGKEALTGSSASFSADSLKDGRFAFSIPWRNPKLWDADTPENMYRLELSLLEADGKTADRYFQEPFGFREFEFRGRDLILNGTPTHLFFMPTDTPATSAASASYAQARESFQRMKSCGMNAVYGHNYSSTPGEHLSFSEVLKAADDEGMLFIMALPHVSDYRWSAPDAEKTNAYRRHVEAYVRMAQNHPSVVMYAMSHNYSGYGDDQNPLRMDGVYDPAPQMKQNVRNRRSQALKGEEIVKEFDKTRPIYHHESGNLGQAFTLNNYLDFVPEQERAEWYGHWAEKGVKPLLLVEYGNPFYGNWAIYRGEYKGRWQNFFSHPMLHQYFHPQWGAQFRGDKAYGIGEAEKESLRYEARMWRKGEEFPNYSYPGHGNAPKDIPNMIEVQAEHLRADWSQMRTWGVSAMSDWDLGLCWRASAKATLKDIPLPTDWEKLQKPGFSPDFLQNEAGIMDFALTTLPREDWELTPRGKEFMRWNKRIVAYIAGKASRFTAKDHNCSPGETIEKQLIVLNDSRRETAFSYSCEFDGKDVAHGSGKVPPGEQVRIPFRFTAPDSSSNGEFALKASVDFHNGETQTDSFAINVVPAPEKLAVSCKIALWDAEGETAKLLASLGLKFDRIEAGSDLSGYDLLVVGRKTLTTSNPAPDFTKVRDGLRVVVFEQTAEALEKRLGFRVQEYGLRRLFIRHPSHPALAGVKEDWLRDWRGEATLLPPYLDNPNPESYPMTEVNGFRSPQAWRCGCYGNLASVLVEKPAAGDFTPILDGGFDLQYAPLLEYREGKGLVLFCQLDLSGRKGCDASSEAAGIRIPVLSSVFGSSDREGCEPAAQLLASNIIRYAASFKPQPRLEGIYAGEEAGYAHLKKAGFEISRFSGKAPSARQVLILGPGGAKELGPQTAALASWLAGGGRMVGMGLGAGEIKSLPGFGDVELVEREHISSFFPAPSEALLSGIGCAELNIREPRRLPLFADGPNIRPFGDGALATAKNVSAAFSQVAPWQFDYSRQYNLKPTFKRGSFLASRLLCNAGLQAACPILERLKNPPESFEKGATLQNLMKALWIEGAGRSFLLSTFWKGFPAVKGSEPEGWEKTSFDASGWRDLSIPGVWGEQYKEFSNVEGVFLARLDFEATKELAQAEDATLELGAVDDEDTTYLNGVKVGSVTERTNPRDYWKAPRRYRIPKGVLKEGRNTLAVRMNNLREECAIKETGIDWDKRLKQVLEEHPDAARWMNGLYLELPLPDDNPYRYYRW